MSARRGCLSEERMWDVLDATVPESDPSVREHLAACPACAARLEQLRSLHEGLERIGIAPEAPLPSSIGPYQVLRVIGQGSAGIVYEARQADPERRVALKVLRQLGAPDRRGLRAFRREIRALAHLDHPGIAAIHDAGRSEEGQVYFAMQLVEGSPLDRHCEERGLSIRARAQLMVPVAEAVHYAHQRGILHRDLKPANILVDDSSRPRVLDFGLALALSRDSGLTVSVSAPRVVGTLAYMSPEQAAGRGEVDPRSDVYSLGVVLYRLLTGRPPYQVPLGVDGAREAIARAGPVHPSRLLARVPRELGDVVMKAIEEDPARRYPSADAFARDLRAFLTGEAVEARPTSALYRLRVFARRNKPAAAGVVGTILALAAGVLMTQASLRETRRQRAEATAIAEVVSDALRRVDKRAAGRRTTREVLDAVARLLEENELLAARPTLGEAMVREAIGVAYLGERAYPEAARHLSRAHALHDALLPEVDPRAVRSRYRAGLAHLEAEQRPAARLLLGRNQALHLDGSIPPSLELAASLALLVEIDAYTPVPGSLSTLRAQVPGDRLLAEPLAMLRGLPPGAERDREEANMLAAAAGLSSELEDKIRFTRCTLEICEDLGSPGAWDSLDPLATLAWYLLARHRGWVGSEDDLTEAIAVLSRRVELTRSLFGPGHELARSHVDLGRAQLDRDPSTAAETFERGLAVLVPGVPGRPPWTRLLLLAGRADALGRAGDERAAQARAQVDEVADRLEVELAGDPDALYAAWTELLISASRRRAKAEGAAWHRRRSAISTGDDWTQTSGAVLARVAAITPDDPRTIAEIVEALLPAGAQAWGPPRGPTHNTSSIPVRVALTRVHAGHAVELGELRALLAETLARNEGYFSMDVSEARWALGLALVRAGEPDEALEVLGRAVADYNPLDDMEDSISRWALARALRAAGRDEQARERLRGIYGLHPWDDWMASLIRCDTALAHLATDERGRALAALDEHLPRLVAELGPDHHYVREIEDRLAADPGPPAAVGSPPGTER